MKKLGQDFEYHHYIFRTGGHGPHYVADYFNFNKETQNIVDTYESKIADHQVEYLCCMNDKWWRVIRKESDESCSFGTFQHHDIHRWFYRNFYRGWYGSVDVWGATKMQDSDVEEGRRLPTCEFVLKFRRISNEQYDQIQEERYNGKKICFKDIIKRYGLGRKLSKDQKQSFVLSWRKNAILSKLSRYTVKDICNNQ